MNKYCRILSPAEITDNDVLLFDVYSVLDGFEVTNPGLQHAIKKLLCAGIRGSKSVIQDLEEAQIALERAIQIERLHRT